MMIFQLLLIAGLICFVVLAPLSALAGIILLTFQNDKIASGLGIFSSVFYFVYLALAVYPASIIGGYSGIITTGVLLLPSLLPHLKLILIGRKTDSEFVIASGLCGLASIIFSNIGILIIMHGLFFPV